MTIDEKYIFDLIHSNGEIKYVVGEPYRDSEIMFSSEPARGFEIKHVDFAMRHLKELQKINPDIRMFIRKTTIEEI